MELSVIYCAQFTYKITAIQTDLNWCYRVNRSTSFDDILIGIYPSYAQALTRIANDEPIKRTDT